tara:strand:+ start:3173 stop:3820 length:648 start_codon:yes stop_codon:yes gene_type:complete
LTNLKDKFIFVCYGNGAGGEQLAVKISQLSMCNTLSFTRRGKRTIAHDVFKSSMLYGSLNQKNNYSSPNDNLWNVVPTHKSPDELEKLWAGSIYIVIETPTSNEWLRRLALRRYRYFYMSPCNTFKEAVGHYLNGCGGDPADIEKLKKLHPPITVSNIMCIVKNIPYTRANRKQIFVHNPDVIKYTQENVLTISFEDVYKNDISKLLHEIENLIK